MGCLFSKDQNGGGQHHLLDDSDNFSNIQIAPNTVVKCVVVGDGNVGKTSLLMSYVNNSFPEAYVPTVFDNYESNVTFSGQTVLLSLWDTAGQEEYDRIRPLSYPYTSVFLVCFSLVSRTSFENIKAKWFSELQLYSAGTPMILVGTKLDLRDQLVSEGKGDTTISTERAIELAKDIKAFAYIECSAKTKHNLKLVFDKAIKSAVIKPKKK